MCFVHKKKLKYIDVTGFKSYLVVIEQNMSKSPLRSDIFFLFCCFYLPTMSYPIKNPICIFSLYNNANRYVRTKFRRTYAKKNIR